MGFINTLAIIATVGMAVALYRYSGETRQLGKLKQELAAEISQGREDIMVLRAEWAYLTRPDRIERLARQHLGMEYPTAEQLLRRNGKQMSGAEP
jgi:cell division protein FtsL